MPKLKIAFFCNGGSPMGITPDRYWEQGTGGAETALIWIAHHLAKRGHEVSVYNDPAEPGVYERVAYKPCFMFDLKKPLDVLVVFRNPWMGVMRSNAKLKVFWSCDQQTEGEYATQVFPWVDHTIAISFYHLNYLVARYGLDPSTAWVTDLGVNWDEYRKKGKKVKNRLIYCSQPERGLDILFRAFGLIREQVPDVSLTITADRRLWGVDYRGDEEYRAQWATLGESDRVNYVGAVPRQELVRLQSEAEIFAYPCRYPELFCLSVAECQVAGTVPVTSTAGSLPTTTGVGVKIDEHPDTDAFVPKFAEAVVGLLQNRDRLSYLQTQARKYGIKRFKWEGIAEAWEKKLEEWLK
jgi:glycosyltransferase involved in cell wall biosynthesis